ncbi:pentatricopeptide repeat-containing protein at3g46870 [Phtheirospermum japonicum]|uniref:Pentatricopeptide repeat-containing protein at3g46870 n=1 Tax=Phtheirospermum japonicum TaxID=374723 RepID=A0A830BN34_9LAMI|nr:pentatricopeptide repeat-containing protein at3g46870 [Phtheirospermum japonicum]
MASTAHSNLTLFSSSASTTTTAANHRRIAIVRCGPRDNRGPLLKGRILSTEAIQAIQSLKRAHRSDPTNLPTHILSRLLKSDLTAAMKELLRQDQCAIAARVFATLKSEYGVDLDMYADMVQALARNRLTDEIDLLIDEMEEGGIRCDENKGLLRLVKALIAAERKESTVRIYGMMKRSGYKMDDYLGKVLSKGLRRFGEGGLADEIDLELGRLYKGIFVKSSV